MGIFLTKGLRRSVTMENGEKANQFINAAFIRQAVVRRVGTAPRKNEFGDTFISVACELKPGDVKYAYSADPTLHEQLKALKVGDIIDVDGELTMKRNRFDRVRSVSLLATSIKVVQKAPEDAAPAFIG